MIAAVNSDICGRHLLLAHGHLARHGGPELLRGEDFAGRALQRKPSREARPSTRWATARTRSM